MALATQFIPSVLFQLFDQSQIRKGKHSKNAAWTTGNAWITAIPFSVWAKTLFRKFPELHWRDSFHCLSKNHYLQRQREREERWGGKRAWVTMKTNANRSCCDAWLAARVVSEVMSLTLLTVCFNNETCMHLAWAGVLRHARDFRHLNAVVR